MRFSSASPSAARDFSGTLDRWFPTPQFLLPRASGIDISDASIKWLTLSRKKAGARKILSWGNAPLASGIVVGGIVKDPHALAQALRAIAPHIDASHAHAALPEEAAYIFSMQVPGGDDHRQVLSMIEFEFTGRVPIPPSAAVYDFDVIEEEQRDGREHKEISVTVFPRDLAEMYAQSFAEAGITLLSLEVEARSIARAVSSSESNEPITLLVDFGLTRTGFAVLKRGVPIFTSTVEVGGATMIRAAMQALSVSREEAEVFCNTEGLVPASPAHAAATEAIIGTASALAGEIARHYHYWDTRRNDQGERMTPVGPVVMVGGSANLNGLPQYIAGRVQAQAARGNIWRHICDLDDYIPAIDQRVSLQFATAAGLALRSA